MSGKTSIGEPVLCCPRNPKIATITIPVSKKMRRNPRSISFLVHDGDMLPAGLLEQVPCFVLVEARVARFDREKKSVVRHARKPIPIEYGMIPARQPVHDQYGEKGGECGKQNGQLKHDREKGWHRSPVIRFSVYNQRVKNPGWSKCEDQRRGQSTQAAREYDCAQPGLAKSHGVVHSVNGKRRENIPTLESSIADALGCFVESRRARILRCDGV